MEIKIKFSFININNVWYIISYMGLIISLLKSLILDSQDKLIYKFWQAMHKLLNTWGRLKKIKNKSNNNVLSLSKKLIGAKTY